MTQRIVFLGTPSFSCPALEHLASRSDVEVVLVVTQPDRPSGRGRKLQAPPIKSLALELGLPIYQVATLRDAVSRVPLVAAQPDLLVVAAFGLILGKSILSLPPLGCVNLHASLLPRYRGANPIAAAIHSGDVTTGLSLMRMDRGLDTGAVYDRREIDINIGDTTETLTDRLGDVGSSLLARHLPEILSGRAVPTRQGEGATCTRPMVKDDGWIDWTRSAAEIERHVRAMWPWPRAWTVLPDGSRVQVHASSVVETTTSGDPGTIVDVGSRFVVRCGHHSLRLDRVQMAGGKPVDGKVLRTRVSSSATDPLGKIGAPLALDPLVRVCGSD